MLLEIASPVQSMFKYRFASDGDTPSELRMNDVGVSDFPATQQSRAWVCFHSPTRVNSARTTVNLNVLNSNEKPVDSVSLTDSFSGEVQAISVPLSHLATLNNFWVEAIFTENGKSRSVRIHYDCSAFTSSVGGLRLQYDASQPDRLSILSKNSCGQQNPNITLDALRIRKDGKIITDVRKFNASNGYFMLENMTPGHYVAEARLGKLMPKTEFTLSSTDIANAKNVKRSSPIPMNVIIISIFVILIILLIVLFSKRKK